MTLDDTGTVRVVSCPDGVEMETRHAVAGPDAVLSAFSTVANLVLLLGRGRPWGRVRLPAAREAAAAAGLASVVIDPEGLA